ncbi:uncharacterized protein EV422DRAFT_262962 [Fimicolochytrium jonesii]|uniref:uncharacterized protein n=1 Tax=Fimicolochytrium jonesii TaxID=1396493 RepID=UPI0022FEFB05|nr:uncharacterized protein EV422DRAFT_262962 [Fimicolochytrium jonesii]KAI8817055.1 hypothetical protein EV422DRAFT_262962 [Fimicolochytrium jonesii]
MTCKSCAGTDHSRRSSKKCAFYQPRTRIKVENDSPENADVEGKQDNSYFPNLLKTLPLELKDNITHMLDMRSIVRLSMVDKSWNKIIDNEDFWIRTCRQRDLALEEKPSAPERVQSISFKSFALSSVLERCVLCLGHQPATPSRFFSNLLVCRGCDRAMRKITLTRAKSEYKLNNNDLQGLPYIQLPNPHYRRAAMMTLYLVQDIVDVAFAKHGGDSGKVS